jgi:hypothetical protein
VDKETFDKKVAALWDLYSATQQLNKVGASTRAVNENIQALIRKASGDIAEALAAGLAA